MNSATKKWLSLSLAAAFVGSAIAGVVSVGRADAATPQVQVAAAGAVAPGSPAAGVSATVKPAETNAGPKPFEVFPDEMTLISSRDKQAIVARITQADGITHDVTGELKLTVVDPKVCTIKDNVVTPVADGKTEIRV